MPADGGVQETKRCTLLKGLLHGCCPAETRLRVFGAAIRLSSPHRPVAVEFRVWNSYPCGPACRCSPCFNWCSWH